MVTNTPEGSRALSLLAKEQTHTLRMYEKIPDMTLAVKMFGRSLALSKYAGNITIEAGEMIAWECLSRGITLFQLMDEKHITQFGLMPKAANTLAKFQKAGGKVKELEGTSEIAKAEFSLNGDVYVKTLTWEDAKKESYPYKAAEKDVAPVLASGDKKRIAALVVKSKYALPGSRAEMLWWRLISKTIHKLWPNIEPDFRAEDESDVDLPTAGESEVESIDASFEVVADEQPAAVVVPEVANETVAETAAVEVVEPETVATTTNDNEPCTAQQSGQIRELFAESELGDKVEAVLKKGYNASAIRNLNHAQAVELIGKLEERLANKKAAAEVVAAEPPVEHTPQYVDAVCNPDQVTTIVEILKEIEQTKPGTCAKFKAKLNASGIEKIPHLSFATAAKLIEKLKLRQVEAFFDISLEKWVAKESLTTAETASDPAKN